MRIYVVCGYARDNGDASFVISAFKDEHKAEQCVKEFEDIYTDQIVCYEEVELL